jgi:hypothetical protein
MCPLLDVDVWVPESLIPSSTILASVATLHENVDRADSGLAMPRSFEERLAFEWR